ncbi:Msc7p [Verticillium alfalfae VaMs.102]|uniref:aldehyde dehydrogenase (NAD(+)) n=1 Tax=Verticillium alfalfae (strain VaMs.102 / ATCC MYA-4576 / FGSC 10136) TaxID=526221 RepID=C9SBE6_VERA1|nr:Msc7p [Verticillium alfalfae VaMs.102]EEY15680.1 Msc7p [Verticillium alfalfae VaMs.102]
MFQSSGPVREARIQRGGEDPKKVPLSPPTQKTPCPTTPTVEEDKTSSCPAPPRFTATPPRRVSSSASSTPRHPTRSTAHSMPPTLLRQKWRATSFHTRRNVLRTMLQHVLDNQEAICRAACLDSGKTMVDAQMGEILVTVEKLMWTLKHGEKALQPSRRPTNFLMAYKKNEVRYEPLGVVAALVSWNYPFHNLMGPIISSIFAGNGVLIKVSEHTAWSSQYFTSIARGALVVHGHDPGLVQTVATSCGAPASTAPSVLAVSNAAPFGLGASVFGSDADPVLLAVVDGLHTGMVAVNDFAVYYAVQLPFGGVGGSGYGRFAGEEGLRGLCNAKSICRDRIGSLGVRTSIPPPVRYPVADQERTWRFTRGIVDLGYGLSLGRKGSGLWGMARNA